ncbi:alpha-ketoglutarate-dependent dioxygenase AlkB [Colwellia sp. BRX8-9]|uniref:alpha-ketoglutarate-dependent dioxygenase AlkB family protein n=1 Tax=Colwellia sp. BRX8-9 TaxID=2759831 RepID=UPI0021755F2E|nr:alpha-ketoglutarate-dependent dioxygenase AlkB [Colwellia sp. BRX8-9]
MATSPSHLSVIDMDLFSSLFEQPINLLPYDGDVDYFGEIISLDDSDYYFNRLLNGIDWRCDQAVIFGKTIETKRKVAWHAAECFSYTYSNITKTALPFTDDLLSLKALVERHSGETYNSCLLNLYHSGEEGMAWHSDGEKDLKDQGAIASLSFGAERKFALKHKISKEVITLPLKAGSLLVMKGPTQQHWLHRLPPTKLIKDARINLTFRTIVNT